MTRTEAKKKLKKLEAKILPLEDQIEILQKFLDNTCPHKNKQTFYTRAEFEMVGLFCVDCLKRMD